MTAVAFMRSFFKRAPGRGRGVTCRRDPPGVFRDSGRCVFNASTTATSLSMFLPCSMAASCCSCTDARRLSTLSASASCRSVSRSMRLSNSSLVMSLYVVDSIISSRAALHYQRVLAGHVLSSSIPVRRRIASFFAKRFSTEILSRIQRSPGSSSSTIHFLHPELHNSFDQVVRNRLVEGESQIALLARIS